ncbi:hypothetical protein Esti_002476 [Eimeria stiedai]
MLSTSRLECLTRGVSLRALCSPAFLPELQQRQHKRAVQGGPPQGPPLQGPPRGSVVSASNAYSSAKRGAFNEGCCSRFVSAPFPLWHEKRWITFHPQRRVVGHRLEIMPGKHRKRKPLPPKVPLHPSVSAAAAAFARAAPGTTPPAAPQQDMTLFEAYRDLQLRWKRTTRTSENPQLRASLQGEEQQQPHEAEKGAPGVFEGLSETLVNEAGDDIPAGYWVGGFRRVQGTHADRPPPVLSYDPKEIFCVFKSSVSAQHKASSADSDLVQTEKLHRKQAGDKVVFGTVLLAGTRKWTLLGKPTLDSCTLAGETLSFRYKKTRRSSRFLRIRHWVTLLRIEEIVVDVEMKVDPPPPRPKRLLDLWANRWLYPEELEGIQVDAEGRPLAESIYDGSEHQQGTYHRRGLNSCYRNLMQKHTYRRTQEVAAGPPGDALEALRETPRE